MRKAYSFQNYRDTHNKPLVGISACLCGDKVRYDGLSKGQPQLIHILEKYLQLQKICPEVAIGMGIPRPPIQLTMDTGTVQATGVTNPQHNFTQALMRYANDLVTRQRPGMNSDMSTTLCGYIFKSRSPSCGVSSTPIYEKEIPVSLGNGIFAHQIKTRLPWLAVADEERLSQPENLQRFVLQVSLTNIFLQTYLDKDGTKTFHNHHAGIFSILPQPISLQLDQIANRTHQQKDPQTRMNYLAILIKALQRMSWDDLNAGLETN